MACWHAVSAAARWAAETATATEASPTSSRPVRWAIAVRMQPCSSVTRARDALELEHRHLVERLVVEPQHLASARDVAHRADERRDRAGARIGDARDQPPEVDRLDGELGERVTTRRPARDGRDQRDLVAVVQRDPPGRRRRG